ncbi:DUF4240 domain-containing protein [Catenulispora rubra]|uniref:DUF4240 domain-containing protein n=1 Tax=Catenulispora rubra TaxID=280293 RepID=UPI0018924500|nr:DUF4240 domain-containing protein [Catenulispora rubra]
MDTAQFWHLVDQARDRVSDLDDAEAVAKEAQALFSGLPVGDITAADQVFWQLMADSFQDSLWAAAYVINGGCSDDGFDYFRGWLILQGRERFEQALRDPDSLATWPIVVQAAEAESELECGSALVMTSRAFTAVTGGEIPACDAIVYPDADPDGEWSFEFDDVDEMNRRLPKLSGLFEY